MVAGTLHKNSPARHAIVALQTLLHWLGFDQQLKWDKYGADGDYGNATVAAVADFARRNSNNAKGKRVTAVLAEKILARYDSLEELKQLAADVAKKQVEREYRMRGDDKIRISSMQTLLNDLGYGEQLNWAKWGADGDFGRSTRAALAAFALSEGLEGDGTVLTLPLAQSIVSKLGPRYGDNWHDLKHTATPAPGSLSIKSVIGSGNRHEVEVSDGIHTTRFRRSGRGLYTYGNQPPLDFVQANRDLLQTIGVTQSELNVMIAVAENEGSLDAINTYDNAFLSFGLFQWTAGQGSDRGELPALLARVKNEDRDLFDKYCGQHGLDVVDITPGDWRTSKTGPKYGRFSRRGNTWKTPEDKAQLRLEPWAFYFWRAGQDPLVQAMEIKHALNRLDWFYSTDDYKVGDHRVSDLVTSEYGVGLILDNHVNRPAHVRQILAKALARVGLADPAGWGTQEEGILIRSYLEIRETHGGSPMTNARKRALVTRKYVNNGTISDQRGSFERH
jgi:peptidoglycan hydrolase-like protein with peptidoglycan-binding domain